MAFPECFTCSLLRSFHTCEVSMYILFTSYSILFWQSICSFTEVLRYFWWASGFRIIGVETHFLTCGLWPPPMDSCYWMQLSGGRTCKIFWLFQSYKIYSESIYYQYIQPKIYSELNAKWIQDLSSIANLCCSMWFNYSLGFKKHTCACTAYKATPTYWQRLPQTFVWYELLCFYCTYKIFHF